MSEVQQTNGAGNAAAGAAGAAQGAQDSEYPSYNDAIMQAWRALEDAWNGQNNIAAGLAEGREYIELLNLVGTVTNSGYAVRFKGTDGKWRLCLFDTEASAKNYEAALKTGTNADNYTDVEYLGFRFVDATKQAPHGTQGNMVYWTGAEIDKISVRTSENIAINAKDGLTTGELYSVGRSGSNTETFVEALLLTVQKLAEAIKNMLKSITG